MKTLLLVAALALLPLPLTAQSRVALGAGPGVTQTDDLSGGAVHAQLSAHVVQLLPGLSLRADALYQQGSVGGSPLSCRVARQQYCTGRRDDNRLLGAGVHARLDVVSNGRMTVYATPVGVGVYRGSTRSREWEAPTAMCVDNNAVVSCPGNPPFTEFTRNTATTSLGWSSGGGVEMAVGRGRVFAEARVHGLLEAGEGMAGAAPLTVGFSF